MTFSSELEGIFNKSTDDFIEELVEDASDDDEMVGSEDIDCEKEDNHDLDELDDHDSITQSPSVRNHLQRDLKNVIDAGSTQPCLTGCLIAIKEYFTLRLEKFIADLGGNDLEVDEWCVRVLRRDGGLNMGLLDVEYENSKSRKFRSRVEVGCFLGLMPSVKNIRSMTREQQYFCSEETRERLLLSQQLGMKEFQADSVHYENDSVTIKCVPDRCVSVDDRNACFSFGNISVLSWGRIVQDAAFHTSSQLYPLGFRCLRQEHDVVLDRVVDCLCEIDSVFDVAEGSQRTAGNERRVLLPLFRITVSWILDDGRHTHRVYEARTPQQAWQAAMLERVGLDLSISAENAEEEEAVEEAHETRPPVDDEEATLRVEIREQRKLYFRALRTEQGLGLQSAVKPRLSVDAVDSFGDELLLRLVEGMEGSLACRSYHFLDSRDREAGKKSMLRAYSRMFAKAKLLDKTICRSLFHAVSEDAAPVSLGPRKRRPDESSDSRKRARTEENKELRALTAAFVKNRTVRMREIEKGITLLKAAMARNVKKRREDAKLVVEAVCEAEESKRVAFLSASSSSVAENKDAVVRLTAELGKFFRPEPSVGPMLLSGGVVGAALEVWEFLSIFAQPLHLLPAECEVPSIQDMLGAAKARDPQHAILDTYTRGMRNTYECASTRQSQASFLSDMSSSAAGELMNRAGMAVCGVVTKDFERVMGLDLVEAQAGDLRVPVNELTWREVARVVLLHSLCKDVGMSDADIGTLVKGRGFYTTPESADRKALKLARRRIAFAYTIRDEYQESLFGFGSGLCVRLPAPSVPFRPEEVVWTELVASLAQVPDSNGGLIYEVVQAAAAAVSAVDTSVGARRLQKALRDCVGPTVFRLESGGASKRAALNILSSQYYRKQFSSPAVMTGAEEDSENSVEWTPIESRFEAVRLLYDHSPDMTPLSSFDLWDKHCIEMVRRAKPLLDSGSSEEPAVSTELEGLVKVDVADEVLITGGEPGESVGELVAAKQGLHVEDSENNSEGQEHNDDEEDEEVEWVAAPAEADFAQAELLSVAMQRCYLVLRDLMTYQQARYFLRLDAIDVPVNSQPLSLTEIRAHLVSGGYADSIFALHCDVSLLLENAMAANLELSPARVAAQKLHIIFERLFFEIVLCWDHPLPFHDSCHACRSAHPISSNKVAICDRCESSYHLQCLTPPLVAPPRSEWYCLPCVEQRGIANAHPYKTADVAHPSDPQALGEVVGIEQLQETLLFVVEFGTLREMWTGKKVRQYALDAINRDADSSDSEQRPALVLHLPSGYLIEDYDRVCGVARAYAGWGASRNLVPAALLDAHSLAARDKAAGDAMFDSFRRAVAVLAASGSSCLVDEPTGAAEWMAVLRSLVQRALYSSQVSGVITLMDDSSDESATARLMGSVQSGRASLAELQAVLAADLTKGDPLRRNRNAASTTALVDEAVDDSSSSSDEEEDLPVHRRRRQSGQRARAVRIVEEDDEEAEFESDADEGQEMDVLRDKDQDEHSDAKQGSQSRDNVGFEISNSVVSGEDDDEDKEDENDLFDAEGRCLTSGGGGLSEKKDDEEEDWEVRQLSRQKGREDALLTQVLVRDVLDGLDVEGRAEEVEEGYDLVREELGSFHKTAANCIVKACMGRPSESLVIDDWCVGWQNKMESLMRDHQLAAQCPDAVPSLCALCGSEESYLGSPFVLGFSPSEYEADLLLNADGDAMTDLVPNVLSPSALSGCTGIKGFRTRNKALEGLVWLPVDPLDAEMERRECARKQRPLKAGSLVVHECCADFMHFNRKLTHGRSQNADNNHIVELLAGLGRAKTSPLGSDRLGDLYWVFAGSQALFVSSSNSDNNTPQRSFGFEKKQQSCVWRVYSLQSDIAALLSWLDPRLPLERTLRRALSLLFPDSVNLLSNSDTRSDSVSKAMVLEEEKVVADHLSFSALPLPSLFVEEEPNSSGAELNCDGAGDDGKMECDSHYEEEDDDDGVDGQTLVSDEEEEEEEGVEEDGDDNQDDNDSRHQVRKSGRTRRSEPRGIARFDHKRESGEEFSSSKGAVLRRGELVLVEASPANRILWEARILESRRTDGEEGRLLYKVHFLQWNAAYDGWFDEKCVMSGAQAAVASRGSVKGGSLRALMQESRAEHLRSKVAEAPALLQSLTAFQFMDELNRASGLSRVPLVFSDSSSSDVAILRSALLMIEMALPLGAVDESEDRWGDNFVLAWRQAVCACSDVSGLMQCQIMLEYGIRTAWLKPAGLKLFSCLPSRALSMRSPTIGLVAMRVWLLDLTVRYDKVQSPVAEKGSSVNKGRPPSKTQPPAGVSAKSGARLKSDSRR